MPIVNRVAAMHQEITAWRRDLHAHPEIGFEVHRTAAIVAEKLKAFGCDAVVPGIGKTGVVGIIKGRKTGSAKVVGLRADMDALPIHEANTFDYRSRNDGRMHACGHDGHTTMLLGAAHYLAETRSDHPGRDEVIAAGETDWRKVTGALVGAVPDGEAMWYQKHMSHHLLPHIGHDWIHLLTNVFLIRDPDEVVSSYLRTRDTVTPGRTRGGADVHVGQCAG